MKAVLCPVCGGKGVVSPRELYTTGEYEVECHGCEGMGWVEVGESDYNPIRELGWEYPKADTTTASDCPIRIYYVYSC